MSKYIFTAPGWPKSIVILIILGLLMEALPWRLSPHFRNFGVFCFIIPGILALITTRPLITIIGRQMTWNRSALLAVSCTLFSALITLIGLILLREFLAFIFGIALGCSVIGGDADTSPLQIYTKLSSSKASAMTLLSESHNR